MAFKANGISIDTTAYKSLKAMITNNSTFKFEPLFSHFKNDGMAKFLPRNGPNRFICQNETAMDKIV